MQPAEEILNIFENIRPLVLRAMNKHPNSRVKAAKELGVSRRTLHRWVRLFNIKEYKHTGRFYIEQPKVKSKLKVA